MQLVVEHAILTAREKSMEKLIIKSDMEHITEAFIELGFSIKETARRQMGKQPLRIEYEGVKNIE
jgi:hypothetical protein